MNETRERIRAIVEVAPGIRVFALARAVGITTSSARRHSEALIKHGILSYVQLSGKRRAFFTSDCELDKRMRLFYAVSHVEREMLLYIAQAKRAGPREVAERFSMKMSDARKTLARFDRLGLTTRQPWQGVKLREKIVEYRVPQTGWRYSKWTPPREDADALARQDRMVRA